MKQTDFHKLTTEIEQAVGAVVQLKTQLFQPLSALTDQSTDPEASRQAYHADELLCATYNALRTLKLTLQSNHSPDGHEELGVGA